MIDIVVSKDDTLYEYQATIDILKGKVDSYINGNNNQLIWILQHYPVYTSGKSTDVNQNNTIATVETTRGGDIVHHGDGQIVVYFVYDLKSKEAAKANIHNVHDFIKKLKSIMIEFVEFNKLYKDLQYKLVTEYERNHGLWVVKDNVYHKMGFIGLRVIKNVVTHGFCININNDISPFQKIKTCGMENCSVLNFTKLKLHDDLSENILLLKRILTKHFII